MQQSTQVQSNLVQSKLVRLVLVTALMLLPACATKEAGPKLSKTEKAAQARAEQEFDTLSWKYEGTPDIFLLNTCYDLYGFLQQGYIDFVGVLECYHEQIAEENTAPKETGPRDVSPKSQSTQ